ncbi:ribosome small subunit-dependent GTPase A [Brevibacillus marinus]|uniref:ribosome small subunit-dependent GTPase A n=1 Tax=Brevibacillus marinus TaxID=2496837 RepID=UPI000F83E3BE|nr:ribosome small subunit-dependent GTPase A [Brevibacillus marinus]
MPEGRIVKALSGFYYVADAEKVVQCRARGLFKKKDAKVTPLVGDWVRYEAISDSEGYVMEVAERKTELIRPPIANIDLAMLVFSMREPVFSSALLDKFLVHTERAGIEAVIILSKSDLVSPQEVAQVRGKYEQIGYRVIPTSTVERFGLTEVRSQLAGRITVVAGQSGVGKSSLINAVFPGVKLQTGEVSQRLGRGRHTTRHVELIPLDEGGYVADTPGFSSLELGELSELELAEAFREFRPLAEECRFRGCLHLREPGCAVLAALARGEIDGERYEHYQLFAQEQKEQKRRNKS